MAKVYNSQQSLKFILLARRSKDPISKKEVKKFYKNSISTHLEDDQYFVNFIKFFNGTWNKNSNNKELFAQFLIELDITSQAYYHYKNRPLEHTFFFHLLASKLHESGLTGGLIRLAQNSEENQFDIRSALYSLLNEYVDSCPEVKRMGVEILGDLGFVYRIFQQIISTLLGQYANDGNGEAILGVLEEILKEVEVSYNFDGLEYSAMPFAEDANATIKCDLNNVNAAVVEAIGVERIEQCKEVTVAINPQNIDADKRVKQIKMLADYAEEWFFSEVRSATAVYVLNVVLRRDCVARLEITGVAETFFEDLEDGLAGCRSLETLVLRNVIINAPMINLFRGSNNLREITFKECVIGDVVMQSFDALLLNSKLEKLLIVGGSKIEFPYCLTLLSSPFSAGSTDDTYQKLLMVKDAPKMDSLAAYYEPGDYSRIPESDVEIDDDLFFHMLHIMFNDKYGVSTPDHFASSLQMWLKTIYERIIPKAELSPVDEAEGSVLHSFRKFVAKDSPLNTSYATVAAPYCKILLAKASTPQMVHEYPFLPKLVQGMIEGICFQRALRVPLEDNECRLTSLSFCGVELCEYSGAAFAAILVSYRFLLHLDLSDNSLGNDGASAIAAALNHNKSLLTLGLKKNNITDLGALKLAMTLSQQEPIAGTEDLVRQNTTLVSLNLDGNEITSDVLPDFCTLISLNRTLQSVIVNGENVVVAEEQAVPLLGGME